MIDKYLTGAEIAEELGLDIGMVKDLIDGKGEWLTKDIGLLLAKSERKIMARCEAKV